MNRQSVWQHMVEAMYMHGGHIGSVLLEECLSFRQCLFREEAVLRALVDENLLFF